MKMTSNGKQFRNIKTGISQQPFIGSYSKFKGRLRRPMQDVQIPQIKMTSHGIQPQNIKSEISQHQLIESFSNFKLKLR